MWIRKFFLTLAMISMAFPTCPVTIDIKTIPHYAFTHGLANQLEHLERSITDTAYMDTLTEEEIWKSFTILSTLIRDNSDEPLETLLLEEEEVREEIASYLQERVNRFHYSMQHRYKPLACGGVIYSVKKGGKATLHGLKKAGEWLWKNKWVVITIIVIAVLAYFGIKAYQKGRVSTEDTNSSTPSKKTTITKAAKYLLPKAQKELRKDLEKELKKNLENIENPTPEKQAQSIAKTSLTWATNTWLECQKFSRDIANQLCHEVLDHAAPMAELAAIVSDQLKKELSAIFAHTMRDYGNGNTAQENVEQLTSFLRNALDEMLASKRTIPYQGATDDPLTNLIDPQLVNLLKPKIGIIPFSPYGPPGTKEAAKAAKQAKNLLCKQIKGKKAVLASIKSTRGYKSEAEVRQILHAHGYKTFPKPKSIPKNYLVSVTKKNGGMKYVHPKTPETSIRVMPGDPKSPFPHQRHPYVVQIKNGKYLNKYGKIVEDRKSAEIHIPLNEFVYKGSN